MESWQLVRLKQPQDDNQPQGRNDGRTGTVRGQRKDGDGNEFITVKLDATRDGRPDEEVEVPAADVVQVP